MADEVLNFDAKGHEKTRDFVRMFFEASREKDDSRREEFQRVYEMYRLQRDMTKRDRNRSNIYHPKLYTTVETIMPYYIDAILGIRPYIPIRLPGSEEATAQAMTDLLDSYLGDEFFWHWVQFTKYTVLFGTGFIECYPDYETKTVKEAVPVYATAPDGNVVQVDAFMQDVERTYFKLGVRSYAPWEIYRDPFAKTPDNARGVVKFRGMTSIRQMKKMAERGAFPDFDEDRLRHDMQWVHEDDWSRKIATDMGVQLPQYDDDMGIWLSYESPERYIDLWNFSSILRDIDNQYNHGKINLTRGVNTDNPNPAEQWYGIGEGKPIEQLCYALNANWDQMFDNHNLLNQGVLFYREDALSVDQLVMIAGNRVPVDMEPGEKFDSVVHERDTKPLSPDFYNVPNVLDNIIDETTGVHEIIRGQASNREQTAREAILRDQRGQSRIKLKIKMGEMLGLGSFADKALSHIDQFAGPDDIVAKIGMEKAVALPTVNPNSFPGGYSYAFKGSDRLAEAQLKRQDWKDLYQLTSGNPNVRQDWLCDNLFQRFDIPEGERRKGIIPDEQAMMIQAQMAQMTERAKAESTRAISNGQTLGGSIGYGVAGRDMNEKLGSMQ